MENGGYHLKFQNIKIPNAAKNGDVIEFFIETKQKTTNEEVVVIRIFEDFELLHHTLSTQEDLAHAILPPLPSRPLASASAAKKKTKQQLGNASLLVGDDYHDDCMNFEKYLQLLSRHSSLAILPALEKFLCEKEPPTRVKVRRGILGTFTKAFGDARYTVHKDSDAEFVAIRQHNQEMVKHTKSVADTFQKITDDEKKLASLCVNLITVLNQMSREETDNQDAGLKTVYGKLCEALEHTRVVSANNGMNRQRLLASTLHLYAQYEEAKKTVLQRRTQRVLVLESAKKTFESAKPSKKDQAEEKLREAEEAVKTISQGIKNELDVLQKQRILAMQSALVKFADAEIKNSRATYALLAKTTNQLQNFK